MTERVCRDLDVVHPPNVPVLQAWPLHGSTGVGEGGKQLSEVVSTRSLGQEDIILRRDFHWTPRVAFS